ncbi:MAG: hypothetical protein QXI16_00025 [Sulfolobaceae archaeon]
MINEEEFITDEEVQTEEQTEDQGSILNAEQIVGIEGMLIGNLSKLSADEFQQFMAVWYPPAVSTAKALKIDKALAKLVKIDNPYITIALGVGLTIFTGIMTVRQIKESKQTKEQQTVETPKVEKEG